MLQPMDEGEPEPTEYPMRLGMVFAHTPTYPEEAPFVKLHSVSGLGEDDLAAARALVAEKVEEFLGMAMIFELINELKEWLREWVASGKVGEVAVGAADPAAAGGLNPATGLPHTAAYLKKNYGPDGNAAVAAGTYGPAGMGAAPQPPVPGDNRLPGQRLVDALYDWLVANNRDGIDPTFMTEFHDACPGHRAKKCKGTGIKRTITQFGGDKLRWAHAPGGKGNGRVVVVGRESAGDDFRAPEDAGAYGPGGPSSDNAFPQTYKYGTGIKKLAPGSPALVLTGSLAPSNPNRLPLANNAQGWAGPEDPASETAVPVLQHHPAVRRNVVLLDLDQTLVHVLPSSKFPSNVDQILEHLADGICKLQATQSHEDQGIALTVAVRKGASDLIWALRNAGNVDLRIVTMNLEGAGVIRAIADKAHTSAGVETIIVFIPRRPDASIPAIAVTTHGATCPPRWRIVMNTRRIGLPSPSYAFFTKPCQVSVKPRYIRQETTSPPSKMSVK